MSRAMILANALLAFLLAAALLAYPAGRGFFNIRDPALRQPGICQFEWRLMRHLTPQYAKWANERVAQGQARSLSTNNISGTEWPLFGSVFYLWAMENLQNAWDAGDHGAGLEPRVYGKDAIVAASELVIDPGHASWVRDHWGKNYLHEQNVFYRMLVIAALASRADLLHDHAHLDILRDQVETLSKELDTSKTGLLDDYPGECYPGDVMAAVFAIHRADAVLGTDHAAFIRRELRAFTGPRSTVTGLPPYAATAETGAPASPARGCGNSYFCLTSPELWPAQARAWFEDYEKFFWQHRLGFDGFREFPKGTPKTDWLMDVDAGPVIDGFGVAADAFGVGAARKNGRFDLAYPLSTEMLATVWELPNGHLAMPRALSNLSDAPLLGEAAILWLLSVPPEKGFAVKTGGTIPMFVYVVLGIGFFLGLYGMAAAYDKFATARRAPAPAMRGPRLQLLLWLLLLGGALWAEATGRGLAALALSLAALLLPRIAPPPENLDWDAKPKPQNPAGAGGS